MQITNRTYNFYQNTNIREIDFLYRSMMFSKGNNRYGNLDPYTLLAYNPDISETLKELNIRCYYDLIKKTNHITGLIDGNEQINRSIEKSRKLSHLYVYFDNPDNIYKYQGAYNTFKYITDTLNEILVTDMPDIEIINKDYEEKYKYISSHIKEIAEYLYECRNSISGSRLSICNHGLYKKTKKENTTLTYDQVVFVKAIAFGTTLDKLENGNYEDGKRLLFVPFK